jgi:hypothetical protein
MTKAEFIQIVTDEIEEAVMRAQGIGDGFMSDADSDGRANYIANCLPSYAFSDEQRP